MATSQMSAVIHDLRRAVLLRDGAGMTDGQLLECFLSRQDEAAFAALVRRHGPMVWGVCRRVLSSHHDAEDAFQATFIVLVRKATSVLPREMVANWLYGVAHQTALKARALAAKRKGRERQVTEMPERAVAERDLWRDLQPVLDQELSRLPDKYRVVVVLCELEGKTRREAALQLGVPEGTVAGRLARARAMLAKRLTRCGLALSGGALAAVLSQHAASAGVPTSVVSSTINAASLLAAGQAAAVISPHVATLTEGVLKAMFITKLRGMAAFLLVAGIVALSGGTLAHLALAGAPADPASTMSVSAAALPDQEPAQEQRQPREQPKAGTTVGGKLEAVDADKGSVTISTFNRRDAVSTEKTYSLAKDAKILQDDKPAKLADLKKGARATLELSADQKSVVSVSVLGSTISAPVKSVDADKNTITITVESRQGKQDKTHAVAKDAKVTLEGKEAKLKDVKEGATVQLTLSVDGSTVIQVRTPTRRDREENE